MALGDDENTPRKGGKVMAVRMPTRDEAEALPFSCSTNLSKDVLAHLARANLGSGAWDFCAILHIHTFGNAGYHRKNGHREIWCQFDLAVWVTELGCTKSNLQRIMAELEACHIIFFVPDSNTPGTGRIGWNIHFEEWRRYDGRRARGRFAQDIQQSNILILQGAAPEGTSEPNKPEQAAPPESDAPGPDLALRKISMSACSGEGGLRKISMAGSSEPPKISMPACSKISMSACQEAAPAALPAAPVRKSTKESITEEASPHGDDPSQPDPLAGAASEKPAHAASSSTQPRQVAMFASDIKQPPVHSPSVRSMKRGKKASTPEKQELEARKAELRAIWLAHPTPRVVKPMYGSGWSTFHKGINLLALDGVQPERLGALIDAMLTWSRGTYLPTPLKMHHNLDEVQLTLMQLQVQQAKKGATHAASQSDHGGSPGPGDTGGGTDPTFFLIQPWRHSGAVQGAGEVAPGEALPGM